MSRRDEFLTGTQRKVGDRVGWRCSRPECRAPVKGPTLNPEGVANIGVFAHITAAARGGPRYEEKLTPEQRRSAANAILLCQNCAKLIDNDEEEYSVNVLTDWKSQAEKKSKEELGAPLARLQKKIDEVIAHIGGKNGISKQFLDAIIEQIEDLINRQKGQHALNFIEPLVEKAWNALDNGEKYKLLRLKALSLLQLGKNKEGAKSFIDALPYNKGHDKAFSNAAWGYQILKKKAQAIEYARKAIKMNPENIRSYCILAEVLPKNQLNKLKAETPNIVANHAEFAMSLGRRAKNDLVEAEKWLRVAVENANENPAQPKAMLAEILIMSAMRGRPFADNDELKTDESKKIKEAMSLLESVYEEIKGADNNKTLARILQNLSTANASLGHLDDALRFMEKCLEVSNEYKYQRRRVELLWITGKVKEAKDALRKIKIPADRSTDLLEADILRSENQFTEAEKLVDKFLSRKKKTKWKKDANRLRLRIYMQKKEFSAAETFSADLLKKNPDDIDNLIDAANLQKILKAPDKAKSLVETAESKLRKEDSFQNIRQVADAYFGLKEYTRACALYERISDGQTNNDVTKHLLHCYYLNGDYKKALQVCEQVRKWYGYQTYFSEVEAVIYEKMGDIPKAQQVTEDYLAAHPGDAKMSLQLARLYARTHDTDKIKSLISNLTGEDWGLEERLSLAFLNAEVGELEKAFDIAYETRRKFIKDERAHPAYISFFMQTEKPAGIHPEIVGVDTVAFFDNGIGEREYYLIEEKKRDGYDLKEISADEQRAQGLLGKKINDEFDLVINHIGGEKGTLKIIQSKHVFAYQESMKEYARMIPNNPAFTMGVTEKGKEKEQLEMMMLLAGQRAKNIEFLEDFYLKKKTPIGMYAERAGIDIVQLFSGLQYANDKKIICCIGDIDEQSEAAQCFAPPYDEATPIMDATAILTVHYLGIEEKVAAFFKEIGISQSTRDVFTQKIEELESTPPAGYLGADSYSEVKPEDIAKEIARLKRIRDWLDKHCKILRVNAVVDMGGKRKEELDEIFGSEFIDSVLLASEQNHFLYSDDFLTRVVARNEFKVKGMWTQLLMMRLLKVQQMANDEYAKASAALVEADYDYTSVNEHVLMLIAEKMGWKPEGLFLKVIEIIKTAEVNSLLRMAAGFLFELMHKTILTPMLKEGMIIGFLNAITQNQKDLDAFLKKLIALLSRRFSLSQALLQELLAIIAEWRTTQLR